MDVPSRLLFLHIPKTAGMAVVQAVKSHFPDSQVLIPPNHSINGISAEDLERSRLVAVHAYAGFIEKFPSRPKVITFLREPLDRAISHYYYTKTTPLEYFPAEQRDAVQRTQQTESLLEYIRRWPEDVGLHNLQVRYLSRKDQNCLLGGRGEDPLEIAKQSLREFDFVGILERLRDSLTLLSYGMKWPPLKPAKVNVTTSRPSVDELDQETLSRLRELNALDIALYEFGCRLFEERWSQMLIEVLEDRAGASEGWFGRTARKMLFAPRSNEAELEGLSPPLEPAECRISIVGSLGPRVKARSKMKVTVRVKNQGPRTFASAQPNPVRLSYRWVSTSFPYVQEGPRTELSRPIEPNGQLKTTMALETPAEAGSYQLRVTLVQEGIRWFDEIRSENCWISEVIVEDDPLVPSNKKRP